MCPYDISQNQFHMNYSEGNFSGIYKMRSYCSSGRAEELLDSKIGVFELEVDGRELFIKVERTLLWPFRTSEIQERESKDKLSK